MRQKILALSIVGTLASMGVASGTTPIQTSYSNFYITYMSTSAVGSIVKYAEAPSVGINHFFVWTIDQDAPASQPTSLLNAINNADSNASIVAYYPNYAVYNNNRAIPGPSYQVANNPDLDAKLADVNTLIYAFAETQVPPTAGSPAGDNYINTPYSYGSVYLYDPWSDLAPNDEFCGKNPSGLSYPTPVDANGYNLVCGYAFDNQGKPYDPSGNYNHYGNFEAFSALNNMGKTSQPIQKLLSIGGYGHNATFEAIFEPGDYGVTTITEAEAIQNFVNSVVNILVYYKLDGVDLDYENVQMTPAESKDYLTLITDLNKTLAPLGKTISLPIISNPAYIAGTEAGGTIGFAPGVLAQIAKLSQVTYIDPMTYDFSGVFNYAGPSNPGTTGFLSNVYQPNDPFAPSPSDYTFSEENAVTALENAGVPVAKIGVGIPAYGRALSNLPASQTDASYLFSPLSSTVVIPAGDQDNAGCTTDINTWQSALSCQGMFSYNYIVNNIVGRATVDDHQDDAKSVVNGTTAFAASWGPTPPPSYTLTVQNQDSAVGIQVVVGPFTSSYEGPGTSQTYSTASNPSTAGIEGQSNLPISFTYWGSDKGSCQGASTLNFTANSTLVVSHINPNGGSDGTATCTVSQ